VKHWIALILDRIIAPVLLFGALWLLFVAPVGAQGIRPPLAWLAELRSSDETMREYRVLLDRPWTDADIRSRWFPQAPTIRLIPVWDHPQTPLADKRIAELWNVDKNVYTFTRRIEAEHGITQEQLK
jgi:hypothetical protein